MVNGISSPLPSQFTKSRSMLQQEEKQRFLVFQIISFFVLQREMAASQVVCPFFGVVFQKLSSLIQMEIGQMWGAEKELKKLYTTFCRIKHVLSDAEEKQFREGEEAIRFWLQELNSAAYEADDVFDECEYEGQQLASEEVSSNDVTDFPEEAEVNIRQKIQKDIQKLIQMFHEIAEDIPELDLQKGNVEKRMAEICPGRETSSFLTEQQVYGRDKDRENLVKLLLGSAYLPLDRFHLQHRHPSAQIIANNSQEDLSICPILGVGGLGKTTLAQMVYNDERVVKHFNVRSWICVSNVFDINRLIKAIIASVSGNTSDLEELEFLQQHLQELLHGQKFLLVLDDVWEENQNEWEKMKGLLRCGAKGSSVMVTTRLETVASLIGTLPSYRPKVLSKDDCWSLFKQRAFGSKNEEKPALVKIGKEIVDKCGGLPLAAKALGGLLRFKHEENEWMAVKKSEIWELPQSSENYILPALRLSYYHLPSQLRQCFIYCSIFPKDHVIHREKLIHLWMANSLVQTPDKMELEDAGNEVFNALLHRSFFQETEKDEDGNIQTCKLHDLVHDLASYIAGNEYFVVGNVKYSTERTRHASFSSLEVSPFSTVKTRERSSTCLRSIIKLSYEGSTRKLIFIFSHFSHLRALDLAGRSVESVPDSIGKMINLRYLNLSGSAIMYLPESICLLRNFQTLKLRNCSKLKSLPKDLRKMSSLRYLDVGGCSKLTSLPAGLGQLSCLQTLSMFIVGMESGRDLNELQGLNRRGGELEIKGLEHMKSSMEAREANLINMKNLRSLVLRWSCDSGSQLEQQENAIGEEVIEGLQPHENLRVLIVRGYQGLTSPSWLTASLVPNLVEISLFNCTKCARIPPLRELPRLKALDLQHMDSLKFIEIDDANVGGFMSLEELSLWNMPNLEGWSSLSLPSSQAAGAAVFPCLKSVTLNECPQLKGVPLSWSPVQSIKMYGNCNGMVLGSLQDLPCLPSLVIGGFHELEYFPRGTLKNLTALRELTIEDCNNLKALPVELNSLTTLTELKIEICEQLVSLVEGEGGMRNLSSLKTLVIDGCHALKRLPEFEKRSLVNLRIRYCPEMEFSTADFEQLVVLQRLELFDLPKLTWFPEGIKHAAATLQHLEIWSCSEDDAMDLPNWIGTLTSLKNLWIDAPKNWKVLPQWMQHLTALKQLYIHGCHEELEIRWEKKENCFNVISHVPYVYITSRKH